MTERTQEQATMLLSPLAFATVSLLAVAVFTTILLWSRTAESTPGVLKTPLPARCQFLHFTLASQQPERTFVVACPGHEYFRVWPLPMGQWNEEPRLKQWQVM